MTTFQELFTNLLNELKHQGLVKQVSSHFGPKHSIKDMFSYMWKLEVAQKYLKPTLLPSGKSELDADRYRQAGNKHYQKKELYTALQQYNLSIMAAPHPAADPSTAEAGLGVQHKHGGLADVEEFRSLALAYANRSAVLFEMGQYQKCISDINLSLSYGYPRLIQSKLAERKAKCLIEQQKNMEAKEVIEAAVRDLESLTLDEAKSKTSKEALKKLLEKCMQENHPPNSSCTTSSEKENMLSVDVKEYLFPSETVRPPVLPRQNPTIPCLSGAVKLAHSPSQGRYLMAQTDIHPGEVLVVEEGYSRTLHLDTSLHTHCSGCLHRCPTPLPCPHCSKVVFCSPECRAEAYTTYHRQECGIIPSLVALDMGKSSVLAYRILSQTTYQNIKKLVPLFQAEAKRQSAETLGFDPSGVYNSADYRTIYQLVTNMESRSVSDLFKRCAMALLLTRLLHLSQRFFVSDSGEPVAPSEEDVLLTGCTLFTHMMNLPCNAHSVTETLIDTNNYKQSISQEIGCGAFGVLSLTNHSCNPAAARFTFGSTVVLRAIRFIPAHTEVTDCYGEHYAISAVDDRKSSLMHQYYFNCLCEPCSKNWPVYSNLKSDVKIKCFQCSNVMDLNREQCVKCKFTVNEMSGNDDVCSVKHMKQSYNKFLNSYLEIISGNISVEHQGNLCSFIELLDKHGDHPSKAYFEAQETLKHCFDRDGSCFLLQP